LASPGLLSIHDLALLSLDFVAVTFLLLFVFRCLQRLDRCTDPLPLRSWRTLRFLELSILCLSLAGGFAAEDAALGIIMM
jgi:hypothetical protein